MRKPILLIIVLIVSAISLNAQFEKEISIESFSELKLLGAAKWELISADEERIVVNATNNEMFDYIEIDKYGDQMVIGITDKNEQVGKLFSSMTFYIYYKELKAVELNGAGSVSTMGKIETPSLYAELSGTGNMFIKTTCDELRAEMKGTGKMELIGEAANSSVSVQGVGTYEARQLVSKTCRVVVSGVGNAFVHAEESLTAQINGVGTIKYLGNPEETNFTKHGLGSIKPF